MLQYYIQEIRDLRDPESGKVREIYKVSMGQSVSPEEFVRYVESYSSMTEGEIQMALSTFSEYLGMLLAEKGSVTLPGFGTFSVAIRPKEEKRKGLRNETEQAEGPDINARSIEADHINFSCSRELLKDVKGRVNAEGKLQRNPDVGLVPISRPAITSRQKRFAAAREYLRTHNHMRIKDYAQLMQMSYSAAQRELKIAAELDHSGIISEGSGSHRIYVLNPKFIQESPNS